MDEKDVHCALLMVFRASRWSRLMEEHIYVATSFDERIIPEISNSKLEFSLEPLVS